MKHAAVIDDYAIIMINGGDLQSIADDEQHNQFDE